VIHPIYFIIGLALSEKKNNELPEVKRPEMAAYP
jgi:hypothetical protein